VVELDVAQAIASGAKQQGGLAAERPEGAKPMTERDWLNSTDPQAMLAFLRDSSKLSERKARLLGVAVCRGIWPLFVDERSRQAVEVAERFADGAAGEDELAAGLQVAWGAGEDFIIALQWAEAVAARAARLTVGTGAEEGAALALEAATRAARMAGRGRSSHNQCALLLEFFGNPFKPVKLDPSVLHWNDACLPKLAASIYDERDFSPERLGVLGDALEEAGVTDEAVMSHCRQQGAVHVRGCWLIDCLTGRE
jgi:hypothetical protein